MRNPARASIEDVARRAKVSITTVSRVINKVSTVSKKNQAKVEEAIAFLKYKPDVSAQRLARGTNTSVGLVMPGYPGIFYSFYAVEIIRGVGHACEILKQDLVFHITSGYNDLNLNSVGCVIFADIIENRRQVESALALGVPCMVINNIVSDLKVNYIAVDNKAGGRVAGDYLVSLGHQRIGVITGNLKTQAGLHRLEGFKEIMEKKKTALPENLIIEGDYSRRSARLATEKLLSLKERPTAIFAGSDDMALEAIAVALERGIKIPQELSVIGFDDNPAAIFGPVALTTVKQPLFSMAEHAVKALNAVMNGKKKFPVHIVLPPDLVVRDSCLPMNK